MDSKSKKITSNPGASYGKMCWEKYLKEKDKNIWNVDCNWLPLCKGSVTCWDGWDAMLIRSRRPKGHKLNVDDNKRKRSYLDNDEKNKSSTKKKSFKVLQEYYHLQDLDKERLGGVMESVTSSVAFIAQHFTSSALSDDLAEGLDVQFNNIYKRLFKSAVKFILDVFNLV